MKYVGNAFGISMIGQYPTTVRFERITQTQFCYNVKNADVNYIGHEGTVNLVNSLCGTSLKTNRVQVTVRPGDEIYIIAPLIRLEEGKVLKTEEIQKLLEDGKIIFVRAVIS